MTALSSPTETIGRSPRLRQIASPLADSGLDLTVPAFVLLAAYGLLRWQTMLPHSMRLRFGGLLALATVLVILLRMILRPSRSRVLKGVLAVIGGLVIVAMIPMAGFPLSWVTNLRIAVTVRAINDAITSLPAVTVPYSGASPGVVAVIALGGGLLTVSSAMALAGASGPRNLRQRTLAAVPLLVLAIIPTALDRPRLQWLHGAALFLLLALFLFAGGGAARRSGRASALLLTVLMVATAGALAIPAGGALSRGPAWVDLTRLVNGIGPAPVTTFDWSQTYGPLGQLDGNGTATVLKVRSRFPTYWKAENLDVFDGDGWSALPPGFSYPVFDQQLLAYVSQSAAERWVQRLSVTVGAMNVRQLIAAGVAAFPAIEVPDVSAIPASSPGTWQTTKPLASGDTYSINVYTPRPDAREMAAAGASYPISITTTELTMEMPQAPHTPPSPQLQFASYAPGGPHVIDGPALTAALDQQQLLDSPYGGVYQLATKLEAKTSTPYDYVLAVLQYLQHGYRYTKNPPQTKYPIPGFLLDTKAGYCQQFAGTMALLLRMGGVPARVAVGFTTGTYNAAQADYTVSAQDAHAWVEVWFPRYGWVPFDPTPAGARSTTGLPVDSAHRILGSPSTSNARERSRTNQRTQPATTSKPGAAETRGHLTRVSAPTVVAVLFGLLALLTLWFTRLRRRLMGPRPVPSTNALIGEVERAFARCGRPLGAATTLSALENRVAASDHTAAAYLRALRMARFGAGTSGPTSSQRRALRAWLAAGLGRLGQLRALVALPPRRLH